MAMKRKALSKATPVITESMEHYLSAIAKLSDASGVARMRDIGSVVGVRVASATSAVGSLTKAGFVRHETYGYVELTATGRKIATDVLRRRELLLQFLTEVLKVDPAVAEADACGMEHCLSRETMERLTMFLEKGRSGNRSSRRKRA